MSKKNPLLAHSRTDLAQVLVARAGLAMLGLDFFPLVAIIVVMIHPTMLRGLLIGIRMIRRICHMTPRFLATVDF
jgi:hypothetical protein